jgi:hypothetical protein
MNVISYSVYISAIVAPLTRHGADRSTTPGAASSVLDMFPDVSYTPSPMPDTPTLHPATRDELMQSLSFALRFNGRKRAHDADETMARITAERLVEHLERSGYVVMHKPGLPPHRVDLGDAIERATKIDRD